MEQHVVEQGQLDGAKALGSMAVGPQAAASGMHCLQG